MTQKHRSTTHLSPVCPATIARLLGAALLMVLIVTVSGTAGAVTIDATLVPATSSDTNADISNSNTYTHALDFGGSADSTVNGVNFTAIGTAKTSVDSSYGGSLTETVSNGTDLFSHGGSALVDGALATGPYGTFTFYNNDADGVRTYELGNLTPGTRYQTNFYAYGWDTSTLDERAAEFAVVDPFGSTSLEVDWQDPLDTGVVSQYEAFYVSVEFVAFSDSHQITVAQSTAYTSAHMAALTNYVLEEDVLVQGDVNANGIVNQSDFAILAGNMFGSGVGYTGGDLNVDGVVDIADFRIYKDSPLLEDGFDSATATATVPEPGSATLLAAAAAFFLSVSVRKR